MSQSRFERVVESDDGSAFRVLIDQPFRFLELDRSDTSSTGGELLVVIDGQLPQVPCDPFLAEVYNDVDLIVRDQERLVLDAGGAYQNVVVRIVESQGKPFLARLRTDTEEIRNHREGQTSATIAPGSDVTALPPQIAKHHPTTVTVDGVTAEQIPTIAGNGLRLRNDHPTAALWIGDDNTVTDAAGANPGYPLHPDQEAEWGVDELAATAQVWVIYDAGTAATAVFAARPGL